MVAADVAVLLVDEAGRANVSATAMIDRPIKPVP